MSQVARGWDAPAGLRASVIIPCHNGAETLPAQLAALAAQTFDGPFEVLVVDNRSTDGSAAVAASWADRLDLRVIEAFHAAGVAVARNVGIEAARSDNVVICDADDVCAPEWVAAMVRGLEVHTFVGGSLDTRTLNPEVVQHWVPLHGLTNALPTTWEDRPYAFGCNMGMRRRVWREVGGFDESYGAGAEEIDFAWRAIDRGHVPAFVTGAVVQYRLRSNLAGVLRQQFNSGLGTAKLFATFRPAVPVRRWHRRLRHVSRLVSRVPVRGGRPARGAWLSALAFEAGMSRGALRHRIAVP